MSILLVVLYILGIIISCGIIAWLLPESFGQVEGIHLLNVFVSAAMWPLTWFTVAILKLFGRPTTQTLTRLCR